MMMLLVAGPPGVGKTHLAEALGARIGWPVFCKDRLKEGLFEAIGFTSRMEKEKINVGATTALCYAAESVLRAGGSLILESNFESRDLPLLKSIAERHRAHTVTIRLDADDETLYRRFADRQHSPQRHRAHIVNDTYPEPEGRAEVPPIAREAFFEGIDKRGMRRFAVGQLIPVNAANPGEIDLDALLTLAKNTSFQ